MGICRRLILYHMGRHLPDGLLLSPGLGGPIPTDYCRLSAVLTYHFVFFFLFSRPSSKLSNPIFVTVSIVQVPTNSNKYRHTKLFLRFSHCVATSSTNTSPPSPLIRSSLCFL